MNYQITQINPNRCKFSYNFTEADCYALKTGKCSLDLSKEEAQQINIKDNNTSEENKVMYCRDFANFLLNKNYYNNPNFQVDFPVNAQLRNCGHYEFVDGQHRTCIAKHLNLSSMYVSIVDLEYDFLECCGACHYKKYEQKGFTKLKDLILSMYRYLKGKPKHPANDFIDEDYMKFK
ncbi:hypothetical protein [Priestia aryabhattai]|uniref:hypothetical protein n=1 Tax=Priestia aryabhattai TaxID=412384 RepID=UPI0008DCCFF3|nr:hypothetical protein [Priestia aryabhattai]OHY73603.1 hypothetical protein BCV52_26130 [Priestia aryabhattai]